MNARQPKDLETDSDFHYEFDPSIDRPSILERIALWAIAAALFFVWSWICFWAGTITGGI